MSKKRKSKTNTISSMSSFDLVKCPYLSFTVKEIGNLPNCVIGQTNYTLNLSSTLEGAHFQAVNNKPLYPCHEKVTHRIDWEWNLKLPFLKSLGDILKLSAEFLVVQLLEEVVHATNPSDSQNLVEARITELGKMVISTENMLLSGGNIKKTQIFYEEVVPRKLTWTNSPFIKYNMNLVDFEIPPDFQDSTTLEITFDSILNLPIDHNEYDFLLELSLPGTDVEITFDKLRFESTAEKSVYKSFSRLARYSENIKYTKQMVDMSKSLQDYCLSSDVHLREKLEDNNSVPQNTCQRFLLPTYILKKICEQEAITMDLILSPKPTSMTLKKSVYMGTFSLNCFLEKEITNHKIAVPLLEVFDDEGYSACVLLEFDLSSQISIEPCIDPQIEIKATKLADQKAICEQNISKYLRIKAHSFVDNFQKQFALKHLRQNEGLTNLKVFDSFYIYSEKHFLTAAVNYLSVNRAKYGNFRDLEVRKKCLIDLCDFTEDVIYKLDERSQLPDPCPKELFELGFLDEANSIHIMVRFLVYVFRGHIMSSSRLQLRILCCIYILDIL